MPRESEHERIKLGTPVDPYDEGTSTAPTEGDKVTFLKSSRRTPEDNGSRTVSIASVVAASLAFVLLVFMLAAVGLSGLTSQEADSPLLPAKLADRYATYVLIHRTQGSPSKAQIQNRLEALKHLEDVGFMSDAKREWIEIRVLTCADDANPVCVFASKRVRSLK